LKIGRIKHTSFIFLNKYLYTIGGTDLKGNLVDEIEIIDLNEPSRPTKVIKIEIKFALQDYKLVKLN